VPAAEVSDRAPVLVTGLGERRPFERPRVVDLTSLWAGPLRAHLLGLRGADVVKVESADGPDGARFGPPEFYALLHHGHRELVIDFGTQLDQLRALIADADLVLTSSRPRAFEQLGLVAEEVVAAGTSWLSITARGRHSASVGFGDDVAASAGLVLRDGADVLPVGDAMADPLAGVAAAVAATEALAAPEARLIDVSMLHVAAGTLGTQRPEHTVVRRGDEWWVEHDAGRLPIRGPRRRGES
jgi:crotonobetainyl-CoA:carnitine CoA-transferase CaiB-like acyl-CoA transferase